MLSSTFKATQFHIHEDDKPYYKFVSWCICVTF
jgi:hypothetical protein